MRRLILLAGLVAGCARGERSDAPADRLEAERSVVMALRVQDVRTLKAGDFALYTVRTEGTPDSLATKIAVVGEDPEGFWIEQRMPSSGRLVVSKMRLDRSGRLQEMWLGDPSGRNAPWKIFPSGDRRAPPPPEANPRTDVKIERETVKVPFRTFDCTKLTSRIAHADGRATTLVTWCHPDVPFPVVHGGVSYGGVVKQVYGRHSLELTATGTNARPELELPGR